MSSHLQSDAEVQEDFEALIKLIQKTHDLTNKTQNNDLAKLGQKYLSTMVTDILLFKLKNPIQDAQLLIDENFSYPIAMKTCKKQGQSQRKLEIGFGRLYISKNKEEIQKVQKDLQTFFCKFGNNKSIIQKPESQAKHQTTISTISHRKDSSSQIYEDLESSTLDDIKNLDLSNLKPLLSESFDIKRHIKEVQEYLSDKMGNAQFNLFVVYKRKTFFPVIPSKEDQTQIGNYFRHIARVDFVNFLDHYKKQSFMAMGQELTKKGAKDKANKKLLYEIFCTHPYIFKDYLHCTQKNK